MGLPTQVAGPRHPLLFCGADGVTRDARWVEGTKSDRDGQHGIDRSTVVADPCTAPIVRVRCPAVGGRSRTGRKPERCATPANIPPRHWRAMATPPIVTTLTDRSSADGTSCSAPASVASLSPRLCWCPTSSPTPSVRRSSRSSSGRTGSRPSSLRRCRRRSPPPHPAPRSVPPRRRASVPRPSSPGRSGVRRSPSARPSGASRRSASSSSTTPPAGTTPRTPFRSCGTCTDTTSSAGASPTSATTSPSTTAAWSTRAAGPGTTDRTNGTTARTAPALAWSARTRSG